MHATVNSAFQGRGIFHATLQRPNLGPQLPLLPQLWSHQGAGHGWAALNTHLLKDTKESFPTPLVHLLFFCFPFSLKGQSQNKFQGLLQQFPSSYPSSSSQEKFHPQAGEVWAVLSQAHTGEQCQHQGVWLPCQTPQLSRTAPRAGIRAVKAVTAPWLRALTGLQCIRTHVCTLCWTGPTKSSLSCPLSGLRSLEFKKY